MPPQKQAASLYSGAQAKRKKPEKPKAKDPFLSITQLANKTFKGLGRGAVYSDDQKSLMEFVGYEVSAEEYKTGQMACIIFGFVIFLVLLIVGFGLSRGTIESPMFLGPAVVGLVVPFMLYFMYSSMPKSKANQEKMLALGYMPEIVNYLIMSMRLTPNLEKAVEFAATHGRGKIAEDLKKIVWDVQIGKYLSVEEALDHLAYNWGAYNEDFKQALMVIRASVLEADTARREALLEKAISDVLEGSKEKMDLYARALHGPTVYLYYFGVLLPLMLAIVVPIGGSFLQKFPIPLNNPFVIGGIYIVALPILIFMMGKMILGGRPPTYEPPEIDEDFPGLPPKNVLQIGKVRIPVIPIAIIVFVACLAGAFYMDYLVNVSEIVAPNVDYVQELAGKSYVELPLLDWPYRFFGSISLFGALIGGSIAVSIFIMGRYYARKKVQDEIRGMETEFKDALYVLASRLGENRPIEDAMKQAVEFLPKSKLANRIFRRVLDNIRSMGMTLDDAVFNPTFGAVKDMPSKTIKSGMGILIDAVGLGVNVAAKSLIGLSMQLRNAERIDAMLRNLLSDVTSMLKTMGSFIAPIVLGVVTSLQGIIGSAIAGNPCPEVDPAASGGSGLLGGGGISGMLCTPVGGSKGTSPFQFTIIMGIYVIEVVILLTYFNAQVEDSNNKLHTYMAIAQALPIATALFCLVAYFAGSAVATAA